MIHAHQLTKSFGQIRVLAGVDLEVAEGELLALLGPNGSGKTTTVRILSTLLRPDAGSATVAGHDLARDPRAVRRSIGLTAQHATVDQLLTGRENLELFGGLHQLGRREARRRAAELLDRFDLKEAANRTVRTYSGGMRRRLDLAASMIGAPRILFLDEPTTGLDPRSRAELWAVIRELLASGTTILLTTQYLEEADQLADRIAVINGGRIVAHGPPAELKQRVGEERLLLRLADANDAEQAASLLSTLSTLSTSTSASTPLVSTSIPSTSSILSTSLQSTSLKSTSLEPNEPGREMTIKLHRPDHLRHVLNSLHDAGIEIERVELHAPTLDDVFFELTRG